MLLQQSLLSADVAADDDTSVVDIITSDHKKTLILRNADHTEFAVDVPRYVCLSLYSRVSYIDSELDLILDDNERVKVLPIYTYEADVQFGAETHRIRVREIMTESDYQNYRYLKQFHYLTNSTLADESAQFSHSHSEHKTDPGRSIVLYAEVRIGNRWLSAGYADLGSSLLIHPVRLKIFDAEYHDNDLHMTFNNKSDIVQVSNRTCRMRRMVVHPDFRSIGLAHHITTAVMQYAEQRYVFGAQRAIFCEASAEMFNHIPFLHSWHFGGMSMGNHDKILDFLRISLRQYESTGELSDSSATAMQIRNKWARIFIDYCDAKNIAYIDGLSIVERYLRNDTDDFDVETWAMTRAITVDVKPYYMIGLNDYANQYIKDAIRRIKWNDKERAYYERLTSSAEQVSRNASINYKQLSVRAKYELPKDSVTDSLMNSFGLSGDAVYANILENVRIEAHSGDVILVVGGSGCGKSMLLDSIDTSHTMHDNLSVRYIADRDYSVGRARIFDDNDMPFCLLSRQYGVNRTFAAFSRMGLAEAFAMIKPYWMLSRGQQYRVMLADLLLRDDDVWILDEFCADLDALTAKVVSLNLHKQIKRTNRIAVVAAANHIHYVDALQPTKVAVMRHGENIVWCDYQTYTSQYLRRD